MTVVGRPFDPPAVGGQGVEILNTVDDDKDAWTSVDVSAEFPSGETPVSVRALVVLGYDPTSSYGGPVDFRFRKGGDTVDYENAQGISGVARLIELDGSNEYLSGGFVVEMVIPVSESGTFEYQLHNRSAAPRNVIKLLDVSTSKTGHTIRVRKSYSDFATAGLTNTIDLLTLPTGSVVESVIGIVATPMSGGGLGSYGVECGQDVGPDVDAYLASFDATAAANTIYGGSDAHVGADLDGAANAVYSATATMKVQAKATCNVNLDLVTAGDIDFYIIYRRLPLP